MRWHRAFVRSVLALLGVGASTSLQPDLGFATPALLFGKPVRLDRDHKLLSWSPRSSPYAHVAGLAFAALETKFPVQDNGLETWLTFSRFDPVTFDGIAWPHNPAGFYAMLTDSAVLWYAFSGDGAAIDVARKALSYQIAHGSTPADWDWARVPYASSGAGDVDYHGADDSWCDSCGRGDGIGVIEPDKVGELGYAYLQMFEATGGETLREAALACADALAAHVREGNALSSPWPFRVYAETNAVREEYSASVVGPLTLLEELERLGLGRVAAYRRAREMAQAWLFAVPVVNDAWSGYFEDVAIHQNPAANINQYSAMRTARWLLSHRDLDPSWREHVAHLLSWTVERFGGDTATERGVQWGALAISEQHDDTAKMASHTARFGATLALWHEATGDRAARDQALRSLNWATYACNEDGVVSVAESSNEGWWFSDGYGDYIRHFLVAMAAVPDWAPSGEDHMLRSSSVVRRIDYSRRRIAWTTFDPSAEETLRLSFRPVGVRVDGVALEKRPVLGGGDGYEERALASGGFLVRIRHSAPGEVVVTGLR
ncbi:MAG TPA: hypothetical protein VKU41_23530 [Polyangiaceae bacterium]|nr:hypothetical protein [Polyangiaceae bacterium]